MEKVGLIAGRGLYPHLFCDAAKQAGVKSVHVVGFHEDTDPNLANHCDSLDMVYVGQLRKTIKAFQKHGVTKIAMCGQVKPGRLFKGMKPDLKILMLLWRTKERNAHTLFGGICDEFAKAGIEVISAVTFLDDYLAKEGVMGKVKINKARKADCAFGKTLAKDCSRLNIGQTVVIKKGTALAVEGFEGTDKCILRGGELGRGGVTVVKVAKEDHDMRFDVPCIGMRTVKSLIEAKALTLAVETGKTLFIEKDKVMDACDKAGICVVGI
ncbi:MAG: UDP-2,3-diacylglucosamine diphosphatase LpxI [Lentisphaeraceae bacterium]|nr:UDP-2,3-diacylglucosamine diphosphatase LpxI [Lentisphaeraceae bacterium]